MPQSELPENVKERRLKKHEKKLVRIEKQKKGCGKRDFDRWYAFMNS